MEMLVYQIPEACRISRCSRTKLYEAIRDGKLIARKNGRTTLIRAEDLRAWIDSFPILAPKPSPENSDPSGKNRAVAQAA